VARSWAPVIGMRSNLILAGALSLLALLDWQALDRQWYDLKVSLGVAQAVVDSPIVVVDIDDASLQQLGRWPWPRDQVAQLLDQLLNHYNSAAIGVDLLFPESTDQDSQLGQVMQDPRISAAVAFDLVNGYRTGVLPSFTDAPGVGAVSAMGYVGLSPTLLQSLSPDRLGHVNISRDSDGVVRRFPMWVQYQQQGVLALPAVMMRTLLGGDVESLHSYIAGAAAGEPRIPYLQDSRRVVSVPAAQVMSGAAPRALLEGALVLVGSSAMGLGERLRTPEGHVVPGVAVQAQMLRALLNQQWILERTQARWAIPALALLSGWLIALALRHHRPVVIALLALSTAVVVTGVNWMDYRWATAHWNAMPWVAVLLAGGLWALYQGYRQQREQSLQVRQMFLNYVPPAVLDQLISGDVERFQRGERRWITVMFADLVGFSRLSEQHDPEELVQIVRSAFDEFSHIILEHGGTVDKYMGDAVMAFWGAPIEDTLQAFHALSCAKELQAAATRLPHGLSLGIGINTGEALVGNLGTSVRHAYSVLGDTVNVAAHLEKETRKAGCSILMGPATARDCKMPVQIVGSAQLKGKNQCIDLYSLQS